MGKEEIGLTMKPSSLSARRMVERMRNSEGEVIATPSFERGLTRAPPVPGVDNEDKAKAVRDGGGDRGERGGV